MATSIGRLSAQATLDARDFARGADHVRKEARSLEQSLEATFGRISASTSIGIGNVRIGFENVFAGLGIGGAQHIFAEFKDTIEEALDLGFLAEQLGTTVTWLSQFQTVASEAGVNTQEFQGAVFHLNKVLGDAVSGGGEAREVFRNLGLDWDQLQRQSFDKTLADVAEGFQRLVLPADRANTAVALFGRERGRAMLRLVNDTERLQSAMAGMRDRGVGLSPADLSRFQQLDDAMDVAATKWRTAWREFSSAAAPTLTNLINLANKLGDALAFAWRNTGGAIASAVDLSNRGWAAMFGSQATSFSATASAQSLADHHDQQERLRATLRANLRSHVESGGTMQNVPFRMLPFNMRQQIANDQGRSLARFGPDETHSLSDRQQRELTVLLGFDPAAEQARVFGLHLADVSKAFAAAEANIGRTTLQGRLYTLSLEASTDAQRKEIAALQARAQTISDITQGESDMASARRLIEQARSPMQVFASSASSMIEHIAAIPDQEQQVTVLRQSFSNLATSMGSVSMAANMAVERFPQLTDVIRELERQSNSAAAAVRGEAEMARTRELAGQARSPFENFEQEVRRITGAGLTQLQQARLITAQFRTLTSSIQQSPLLGNLELGGQEAATVLHAAMAPQLTEMAAIHAIQQAQLEQDQEAVRILGVLESNGIIVRQTTPQIGPIGESVGGDFGGDFEAAGGDFGGGDNSSGANFTLNAAEAVAAGAFGAGVANLQSQLGEFANQVTNAVNEMLAEGGVEAIVQALNEIRAVIEGGEQVEAP